jgi:hypothetical protein
MTTLDILWGKLVILLWGDANKTAAACERWHARLSERIDAKMLRRRRK